MKKILLILLLALNCAFTLSLDDDDADDFEDAIENAQRAGNSENLSKARGFLEEADSLGVNSLELQETTAKSKMMII